MRFPSASSDRAVEMFAQLRQTGPSAHKMWASLLLALVSGLLLTTAFPPLDLGWMAFVALIPFLRTFPFMRSRVAFLHGFVFGLAYFCGLLYWIAVFAAAKIGGFGVAAWLILSARESLWVGVFAVGSNIVYKRAGSVWTVLAVASLWTIFEYVRQLGALGFGWGDLAYSQWRYLPVIQIASVTGIWGVSWLIVLVNAALASARVKPVLGAFGVLCVVFVFGTSAVNTDGQPRSSQPRAAALQANILEDVPYDGLRPADSGYFYGTLSQYDQMAGIAKDQYGCSICVTAETSVPGYPLLDPELRQILSGIARRHQVTMIMGARTTDITTMEDTNSVIVFRPDGSISAPYSKQQLVPFGEYVPYRKQFPFLNSFHVLDYDMQAGGPNQPPLSLGNGVKAGVAVCYESTYPRFMREQVKRGATFDVVVTDDAWYGRTAAAKQHLAMSVLRAVETNRYVVRCASTGISAIIDPRGRIEASAPLFTKRIVTGTISQRHNLTAFVTYGDWWILVCVVIYSAALVLSKKSSAIVEDAETTGHLVEIVGNSAA